MSRLSKSSQFVDDDGMTTNQGNADSFSRSYTMERLAQFNNEFGDARHLKRWMKFSRRPRNQILRMEWAARTIPRPTSTEIQSLHKDYIQNEKRSI